MSDPRNAKDIGLRRGEVVLGALLMLVFLAAPVPSLGQQPGKVYRIGFLGPRELETTPQQCPRKGSAYWQAFVEGMRDRGYVQGQNLGIECRFTEGREERAPAFAAELVELKVDLIVAYGTNQVRAAKSATRAIPIVMTAVINPVERGLVASLARPGGNVTGQTDDAGPEILGKYLELLTTAVPKVSRIAAFRYWTADPDPSVGGRIETEARALGVAVQSYYVRGPEDLAGAFSAMTKARTEAFFVGPHPFFGTQPQRIVDLAAQSRLPAVYPFREHAEAGGLIVYGVNGPELRRQLGAYVDRILKGAKPGDLPVEQPTKFTLTLNLKTAKALGLTIPPALLIQADEVIR